TPPTGFYTLSLHDALPILRAWVTKASWLAIPIVTVPAGAGPRGSVEISLHACATIAPSSTNGDRPRCITGASTAGVAEGCCNPNAFRAGAVTAHGAWTVRNG